ncbi:MAG: DUF2460 domain-containing protein [Syntrophales bacterium]|jgi:hypothetical protein
MAQYPTSPVPQVPYTITPTWKTIITGFDNGAEQRKQKRAFAKYDVTLTYDVLLVSEIQALWNFYQSQKGAFGAFFFYALESAAYTNLAVGIGDASTLTFDIPGKSTSSQSVYVNGVIQSSGITILVGGGQENSDRVQFNAAPALGAVISCDFTGYLRIRCRFKNDQLSRQMFEALIYKTGIELQGLNLI